MNINELTGVDLDLAVATCEGYNVRIKNGYIELVGQSIGYSDNEYTYAPSNNWEQAGEIIEREGIALRKIGGLWYAMLSADLGTLERVSWSKETYKNGERYGVESYKIRPRQQRFEDKSPLVAAMRCFVASKTSQ